MDSKLFWAWMVMNGQCTSAEAMLADQKLVGQTMPDDIDEFVEVIRKAVREARREL